MTSDTYQPLIGSFAALIIGVPLTIIGIKGFRKDHKKAKADGIKRRKTFFDRLFGAGEILLFMIPCAFLVAGLFMLGVAVARML